MKYFHPTTWVSVPKPNQYFFRSYFECKHIFGERTERVRVLCHSCRRRSKASHSRLLKMVDFAIFFLQCDLFFFTPLCCHKPNISAEVLVSFSPVPDVFWPVPIKYRGLVKPRLAEPARGHGHWSQGDPPIQNPGCKASCQVTPDPP